MSCSFLTDQNFLDAQYIANRFASSENANFPASNLYDNSQRSRVWRSGGSFEIGASSNTLVFRETDGVDLTATLTIDRYAGSDVLATEIKAQLEAVGASTYTVEIDSLTGKWKISSNGSGGDGRFEIIWTDLASQGLAPILGFSTSIDDTGSLVYTGDYLSIHTEEWLLWDLGLPSIPNAFYLFADYNTPIPISPSASMVLQGNFTDNFSTQIYSQNIAYDGRVLSHYDENGFGTTYLRYWRFKIEDSQNSNGFIQLGYSFLGGVLQPSRGGIAFGFNGLDVDFSDRVRVVGGQIFSNRRSKTKRYSFEWKGLTKQDKELFEAHFATYGTSDVFVASLDQNLASSSEKEVFLQLVRYESEPNYTNVSHNNFTMRMVLEVAL